MANDLNSLIAQTKTIQAQRFNQANNAKVTAMGGKPKSGSSKGLLSRVLDVVSRPLYATAEPVARFWEGKGAGDIAKGVVSGLEGKSKTDYGVAIQRGANAGNKILQGLEKNKIGKTVAALAGDVLLDPTTYLGGDIIKAGGELAAKAAKAGAVAEHVAKGAEDIAKVGEEARALKASQIAEKGYDAKKVARLVEKSGKAAERGKGLEILGEGIKGSGQAAYDAAKTSAPGKVALKFAGREVASSEKLYNGVAHLGQIVGDTSVGGKLNEAFRTAAKFPEMTNSLRRRVQLAGIMQHIDDVNGIKSFFGDLNAAEKSMVSHAIEGTKADREAAAKAVVEAGGKASKKAKTIDEVIAASNKTTALHGVMSEGGKDLGTYVDKAKEILDGKFKEEYEAGLFRDETTHKILSPEDAYRDRYVPHVFEDAHSKDAAIKKFNDLGSAQPNFTKARKTDSIAELKAKGVPVIEDIDRILAKRVGTSTRSLSLAKYADGITKEYGHSIEGLSTAGRKKLEEEGLVRIADHPLIDKNMYFPKPIADTMQTLIKAHKDPDIVNQFAKTTDKLMNEWKFLNTAANPGHHVRNMIGDAWNAFALGGVNPAAYAKSRKIIMNPELEHALTVGELKMSSADVLRHEAQSGARQGFTVAELEADQPNMYRGIQKKIANVADTREHFMRLATYTDKLQEYGKDLKAGASAAEIEKVANKAAEATRHIHIDFGDMTDFEKSVMKRAMPFYTWTRKNLPLQIEALFLHPGRVSVIPKGTSAIQRLVGADTGGYNNDPVDVIPQWLKDMAPIRLKGEGQGKNSIYWAPALPFDDIDKYTGFRKLVSQTTPFARVPFELATKQKVFSGAPTGNALEYAASQVSPGNQLLNLITGKQKLKSAKTLNYLTGAGVYETTPAQVQAELHRQGQSSSNAIKALRAKARAKALGGK